ncbi:MAG TPA: sulfurtransferase [Verrucomicrobiae bacterium]|nr:sulfurtransferase [Verrucomicrobiae bacterium]
MAEYAHPEALVDTAWLAEHAKDPNVRVFEVDVDTSAYEQGHVDGAIGINWRKDLQQSPMRDLLDKRQVEDLLSKWGATAETTIAIYGDNNNWFAAWFFWLLKYYGHKDARLVNGGRAKWIAESRPLTTATSTFAKSDYRAKSPDASVRALRDLVLERVTDGRAKLIDVRSPKEYAGELLAPENLPQEGAQRGGHIPGAQNVPWATAVAEDGRFKPADELRSIYEAKGLSKGSETIAYCRIGERSAHTWFVLRYLLGHDRVRNYDGSWTEWGSLIGVPIEKS